MTTATMNRALQQLAMDGYVELYELDTSPLFLLHGTQLSGGTVYRWTSGIVEVRAQGTIPAVAQSTTVLTLEKQLPLMDGRPYQVVVELDDETITPPTFVASFAVVGGVTKLTLALALPSVPTAGMAYTVFGTNPLTFRGNTYTPMPIMVSGFEWSGQGTLPRPKLSISNVGGLAGALAITYGGDLAGATITRLRTLREFLDDGDNADPTSFCEPDVFVVDRKSAHNKNFVEFELAATLDQQGKKLPGRIMLRDTCNLTYRQWVTDATLGTRFVYGTCPYTDTPMYDNTNALTVIPADDVCSLRQSGCTVRFGSDAVLPFSAFPGISIVGGGF
jgi:lambda family phage minor tail protein L